jgi:hypothetical protein
VVLTLELGLAQVEVQPSWHYKRDTQWSAQQVLQVSPSVDCNWNKVFSFELAQSLDLLIIYAMNLSSGKSS